MGIAERQTPTITSHFVVGGYADWIMLGYSALAIVALAAVYFASGGPGTTETWQSQQYYRDK